MCVCGMRLVCGMPETAPALTRRRWGFTATRGRKLWPGLWNKMARGERERDARPTDAEVLMHLVATFFDARLWYLRPRPLRWHGACTGVPATRRALHDIY